MTLDDLTAWLFERTAGGIKWGLDTTRTLLAGGGDPHRLFRSVHIAGTNGKGSVAAFSAAALQARQRGPVGLYTSPHLKSFAERIQVDGVPVAEERIVAAARRLELAIEETGASFFEATTAIAFLCFAEAGVEAAVVEVGLGGRLDATNVLEPALTVVTNVAMDHTVELGDSLPLVAGEKAGIFKPGVPAITGESPGEALDVLRQRAGEVGAPLTELDRVARIQDVQVEMSGTTFRYASQFWGEHSLRVPLVGEHQARNAVLAAEAMARLPDDLRPSWSEIERGFQDVRWPGRFQVEQLRGTTWIFDVAHNPAGVAALQRTLALTAPRRPIVLLSAVLADKAWQEMLLPLAQGADGVVLTQAPSAPASRRWDPDAAAEWLGERVEAQVRSIPTFAAALARATTLAPHGTVLVTGSVHTVGDALGELGF